MYDVDIYFVHFVSATQNQTTLKQRKAKQISI